jgi:hypothetical protein
LYGVLNLKLNPRTQKTFFNFNSIIEIQSTKAKKTIESDYKIVKATISYSETKNLGNYSSVSISYNIVADIEIEDGKQDPIDVEAMGTILIGKARQTVQSAIVEELEYNSVVTPDIVRKYKGRVTNGNGNGIDF